ncbi:MAG: type II toxin-antitoxin system PemK/MazF family toxin [Pyrinomonadaceae bacterium]
MKRGTVLVLTNNELILQFTQITVAQITSTVRGNASEVFLGESDGLFADCVVNHNNIKTVEKRKLSDNITLLSKERMREVRQAIEFVFNLRNL